MSPSWLVRLYQVLFIALPWSVEWPMGASTLVVPAEPLIAAAGLALVGAWGLAGWPLPRAGSLVILLLAWAAWFTFSTACSTLPLVSWKYWLVGMGHWWVFGAGVLLFPGLWEKALPGFWFSMAGVAVYTLLHHGLIYHFQADQAALGPMPFFADHTVFGAVMVMGIGWWVGARRPEDGILKRWPTVFLTILFVAALILSGSRAALITLLLCCWAASWFVFSGKKARLALAVLTLAAGALAISLQAPVKARLATDVSSLERLNRWSCARRMADDRPLTGFGPGTFQFQYLGYQRPGEMTRISITAPIERRGPQNYGRGGGAHSEYWQALSEQGWPGLLIWLALTGWVLLESGRRVRQAATRDAFWLELGIALGLLSFFLHALVNNFLHDAPVAALVWGAASRLQRGKTRASGDDL